jgi:hypothetical protein
MIIGDGFRIFKSPMQSYSLLSAQVDGLSYGQTLAIWFSSIACGKSEFVCWRPW